MRTWVSPHGTEWEAETYEEALEAERDSLSERVGKMLGVIEAARPFVDQWDFHACDYLVARVDGAEVRIIEAALLDKIIAQQKTMRLALAALDTQDTEQGEGAGERRIRCCGRRDNCQRDALPGSDYCGPCQDARAEQNTDEQGERDG